MTKKEMLKCMYDYETCNEHDCGECLAYQGIIYGCGEHYNACQLLTILICGVLAKEEDEN